MVLQKREEANIDGTTLRLVALTQHLHLGVAVLNDALPEYLKDLLVGLNVRSIESAATDVETLNEHIASGKGGGLASNDINDLTGSLKGIEVLDKKILLLK